MGASIGLVLILLSAPQDSQSSVQALWQAIENEKSRASGSVSILLSFEDGESATAFWPTAPETQADDIRMDVVWQADDLFRIRVWQKEEPVREIVCDGAFVDTGNGMLWEVAFLKSMAEQREFYDLMWPYVVFRMFLFPLSQGQPFFPYRQLYANMPSLSAEAIPPTGFDSQSELVRIVCGIGPTHHWNYIIDRKHGHIVTSYKGIMNDEVFECYEFSQPFEAPENVWFSAGFRYILGGMTVLQASLIEDSVSLDSELSPADFALPSDQYHVIRRRSAFGSVWSAFRDDVLDGPIAQRAVFSAPLALSIGIVIVLVLLLMRGLAKGKREAQK